MINPEIGLTLKIAPTHTYLPHYTESIGFIQTVYILVAKNLFGVNSLDSVQLYMIFVKHHLREGWYFADGVDLSENGAHATKFLHNAAYTKRAQTIAEMNQTIERIVPIMLREKGVPSVPPLLSLTKYTWLVRLIKIVMSYW